ncbi:MAG TPA: GDP-L-fucose synthase [Nitrospirota bacterium]|nr:GDP-L-fucose synthase [Nitrospirota bacterium]
MDFTQLKTFVAGHTGLVGSAIFRRLTSGHYRNIIVRTHKELDLLNAVAVDSFFQSVRPDIVYLAAARVGGIYANNTYPVEFLLDNLKIQNNVLEAAWRHGVQKLLFLGSSCIYPKLAPQPLKEEYLLTSPLEPTNEPYAIAKIAGIKLCGAMNRQYNTNFISVMPTNLYGPNDNYHPENAHVIPMLLRRFHEAKCAQQEAVTVWGTGTPRREFMYVDDMADACVFLMENVAAQDIGELINIGTGEDCTIRELAEFIKSTVSFRGHIVLDPTKPDGTPHKLLDVSRLHKLGWKHKTSLEEGLKKTYDDFLGNSALQK